LFYPFLLLPHGGEPTKADCFNRILFDFLTKIKVPPGGFRGEINGEDELRRIVETGFIECLILYVYIILYRIKLL
jgi:hypothetical protein